MSSILSDVGSTSTDVAPCLIEAIFSLAGRLVAPKSQYVVTLIPPCNSRANAA
jgi:hypothetical protein